MEVARDERSKMRRRSLRKLRVLLKRFEEIIKSRQRHRCQGQKALEAAKLLLLVMLTWNG
ncbi:hypothetical protein GN244_ATG11846 [Phytophthora infestans]|uniref:Uncharacterized protein n=1 Tax=Phytophthora infestans TaxID=4787 RepID=A0A833T148_PHYIN|nr:hypothetical protein GN244_ATG11846 [Phytophthora infestans]